MSSRAQGRAVLLVLRNRKFRVGPDTSPHPFRRRRNACWDTEVVVREEFRAHVKVVRGRVVFRDIVGVIFGAGRPENDKLALVDPVGEPMEAHVNGLPSFDFGVLVDEADGGGVVDHYGRGWLGVAELLARGTDGAAVAGGFERGGYFSLHH